MPLRAEPARGSRQRSRSPAPTRRAARRVPCPRRAHGPGLGSARREDPPPGRWKRQQEGVGRGLGRRGEHRAAPSLWVRDDVPDGMAREGRGRHAPREGRFDRPFGRRGLAGVAVLQVSLYASSCNLRLAGYGDARDARGDAAPWPMHAPGRDRQTRGAARATRRGCASPRRPCRSRRGAGRRRRGADPSRRSPRACGGATRRALPVRSRT